jgi:hypothetical protein
MGNFSETVQGFAQASQTEEVPIKKEASPEEVFVEISREEKSSVCMWKPKQESIDSTHMTRFQDLIEKKYQLKFGKIQSLPFLFTEI